MSFSFKGYSFTAFFVFKCRSADEWYRIRRILNIKMLKPKVTDGYAEPLNDVASDLITQMKAMRGTDGMMSGLQDELFKWSLECELVIIKLTHY